MSKSNRQMNKLIDSSRQQTQYNGTRNPCYEKYNKENFLSTLNRDQQTKTQKLKQNASTYYTKVSNLKTLADGEGTKCTTKLRKLSNRHLGRICRQRNRK
mmetsp:Transcript_17298/g.57233  ORF Transcript_17298/g.57233 Transcript_17298/m.57233 type:complete len:100 (-) Transcript_17298:3760-4059(-)